MVLSAALVLACGPSASENDSAGGEAEAGSGGDGDSATSTGGGPAVTTAETSAGSTGEPFSCERGEELIPGLCFDRYPVELPGPLVGDRATGANLDALGGDELVVEVLLEEQKTLVVLEFDLDVGVTLQGEMLPTWHGDLDSTELLRADVWEGDADEVVRTMDEALNICGRSESDGLHCNFATSGVDELAPAAPVDLTANTDSLVRTWLIAASSQLHIDYGTGLTVWKVGGAGTFRPPYSTPPCEELVAAAHGDINNDGFVDIVHRSAVDCVAEPDPRRDDVNLLLGRFREFDAAPGGDAEVEPELLVVYDVDGDGFDDVVVHEPARGEQGYRRLPGGEDGLGGSERVAGPAGVDRLALARFSTAEIPRIVYSGPQGISIGRPKLDGHDPLSPSLGRLLAVADVDGDGRDDLLLSGPSGGVLELLVVAD